MINIKDFVAENSIKTGRTTSVPKRFLAGLIALHLGEKAGTIFEHFVEAYKTNNTYRKSFDEFLNENFVLGKAKKVVEMNSEKYKDSYIHFDYPFSNTLNNGLRLIKDYLNIESIQDLAEDTLYRLTTIRCNEFNNFLNSRETNEINCGINQNVFDFVIARECLLKQESKSNDQIARSFFDLLLYGELLPLVINNIKEENTEKCFRTIKSLSLSDLDNRFSLNEIKDLELIDLNELYFHIGGNIKLLVNIINYYSEITEDVIPVFFENYLKTMDPENKEIVRRRETETLQAIGDTYGVTRERIRQIEEVELVKFQNFYANNFSSETKDLIFVFPKVSRVFSINTYEKQLGKDNDIFRNFFKSLKYPSGAKYYEVFDAVLESDSVYSFFLRIADEVLGDYFKKSDLDEKITLCLESLESYGFSKEVLLAYINNSYKDKKTAYVKHGNRLSRVAQTRIILENNFDDGFHYSDIKDIEEFNKIAVEEFGDVVFTEADINSANKHTIQAVVERADVRLVGRGTYVHVSKAPILEQEIVDKIVEYINSKNCPIPYSDLFETFKDELVAVGIMNKYALQGALSPYHGGLFAGKRDYVTPIENQSTLKQIILNWMANQPSFFDYEDFEREFKGVAQSVFVSSLYEIQKMAYYWRRGYINIDRLGITEEEKSKLKQLLQFLINQYHMEYCSADEIYDLLNIQMNDFLKAKEIKYSYDLFSVLQILFEDDFKFQRPLIGSKDAVFETSYEMLEGYLSSKNTVNLTKLRRFLDSKTKNRYSDYITIGELIKQKWNEFVAIDLDTIVRKETLAITDKEIIRLDVVIDMLMDEKQPLNIEEDIVSKYIFKEIAGIQATRYLIFGVINTYLHDKYELTVEGNHYRTGNLLVNKKS